jgi:hypothetical protein
MPPLAPADAGKPRKFRLPHAHFWPIVGPAMPPEPHRKPDPPPLWVGAGALLATGLAVGLGLVLILFAALREDQVFWTRAGGYPVALLDLVTLTYMPLFVGTVVLLYVLSVICFAKLGGGLRWFALEVTLLLVGWGLVTTSGYLSFQDNVSNLIHGQPFHQQGNQSWK